MSYSWGAGPLSARTEGLPVVRPSLVAGWRRRAPEPPVSAPPEIPQRGADLQLLAAELAPMVDVWRRLLADHVPDRAGRCRTCTKGGTGLPSTSWPCSIHGIAELARRRHVDEQR